MNVIGKLDSDFYIARIENTDHNTYKSAKTNRFYKKISFSIQNNSPSMMSNHKNLICGLIITLAAIIIIICVLLAITPTNNTTNTFQTPTSILLSKTNNTILKPAFSGQVICIYQPKSKRFLSFSLGQPKWEISEMYQNTSNQSKKCLWRVNVINNTSIWPQYKIKNTFESLSLCFSPKSKKLIILPENDVTNINKTKCIWEWDEYLGEYHVAERLKHIAKVHGFSNNQHRKKVYPMFLENNANSLVRHRSNETMDQTHQIYLDVKRTGIINELPGNRTSNEAVIGRILNSIFDVPYMSYTQGFDDVISVLYSVFLEEDLTITFGRKLFEMYFGDYATRSPDWSISAQIISNILKSYDSKLHRLMFTNDVAPLEALVYACQWWTTWFIHRIRNISIATRIFDYLLVTSKDNPRAILYLSAAFIVHLKQNITQEMRGEKILQKVFQDTNFDTVNWNNVFQRCERLNQKYPFNTTRCAVSDKIKSRVLSVFVNK